MSELHLYGISNCDTVKKARLWLADAGIAYQWHDLKKSVPAAQLQQWLEGEFAAQLVNRQGATWRKLDAATQARCNDDALPVLLENSSLIKRPLLARGDVLLSVGFKPETYQQLLKP